MPAEPRKRKSTRYREIAARLQKEIRLGRTDVGGLLPTETELMGRYGASRQTVREALRILMDQGLIVRAMPAALARPLQVKTGSPALTVVRRYYGAREELFEVTVTTHPEGRYTYTMDMQRSLRPRV
jgi:DNA-binding GntR family transcriptional regulator